MLLAAGFFGDAPAAAAENGVRMYAVTSQEDNGGHGVALHEILAIGSDGGKSFVRISNGDATASFTANVESDGEISSATPDPGLICYNMAAAVVGAYAKNPKADVPLYMRFLDQIVTVPLTMKTEATANGANLLTFQGRNVGMLSNGDSAVPSGLFVQGNIVEADGTIESATFDEATLAGVPAQRMSGTNCTLSAAAPTLGA
jgi:hypothetical protein